MGTFSIWHWIIIILLFGFPLLPIALADKNKRLGRKPYAVRLFGAIALIVAMNVVVGFMQQPTAGAVVYLLGIAVWLVVVLWTVHRTQDTTLSKWWCLVLVLPLLSLVYLVIILFVGGKEDEDASGGVVAASSPPQSGTAGE